MKRMLTALALLFVASTTFAAEGRNNIVILLDTSGSMSEQMTTVRESKWNAAKKSLIAVVDQIPADTNVGLLLFNPEDWKYDLGPVDRAGLIRAIQNAQITQRSGTPLGTYIKKGVDRLLEEREKAFGYGTYKLLVVTDGDPTNEPRGLVDKYLPDVLSRGITVECIGVSMARSSILKDKVHKYMSADDPDSLTQQIVASVQAEVATDDVSGFEELGDLHVNTAEAILTTLSTTGNHPIGEEPPKVVVDKVTGQTTVIPGGPAPQVEAAEEGGMGVFGTILLIVVVVLLVLGGLGVMSGGNRY